MELVAEYSAWAAELRRQGRLEDGAQLIGSEILLERSADEAVVETRGMPMSPGTVTGLFIIRADSQAEALHTAATNPHLVYGGRVGVRTIAGR